MSRSPQEVLDMAEKRTTYKLQDVGGIGEVKIADEVVTVIDVPRSLATTRGIIHLFSLPAVTNMLQFPALALNLED